MENEDKNINAAYEASGKEITDADIVERYESLIEGMGPHLIGKPELNDLVYAYENKRTRGLIFDYEIEQGKTTEEAQEISDKQGDVLLAEALSSYKELERTRLT